MQQKAILPKFKNQHEAAEYYEKQRLTMLATAIYPDGLLHPKFKYWLQHSMCFQSPFLIGAWDNKEVVIKDENGDIVATTWDNMCYGSRSFVVAEIFACIDVLKSITPMQVCWIVNGNGNLGNILENFNDKIKPEIKQIIDHTTGYLLEIEHLLTESLRQEINAKVKIMLKIPISKDFQLIPKRTSYGK